jgi:hypothetical protein
MSKTTIVRWFWGSLIALVVAVILIVFAGSLLYFSGSLIMNGPDVVGIEADAFAWSMVAIAMFAVLVVMAAGVAQLVAWIGAILNTAQLQDKAWFVVLLVTGLLGIGLVAMIAYAIAGPDGTQPERLPLQAAPPTSASGAALVAR